MESGTISTEHFRLGWPSWEQSPTAATTTPQQTFSPRRLNFDIDIQEEFNLPLTAPMERRMDPDIYD
jgi:hypothetical protein